MFRVDEKSGKSKPYKTKLPKNGDEIIIEIDPGATVTLISEITF